MKRSTKTIIYIVALAVLFVSYRLILNSNEKAQQVSETQGHFALTERTSEELTDLSWSDADVSWHFTKADDAWANADDVHFPTKQDAVQELADELVALEGTRKLEDVEKPEDYGLTEASFAVTAQWSDGSETTYTLGDETPFGDGYYLSMSGDASVYTIGSDLKYTFPDDATELAELEQMPAVANASRLVIGTAVDAVYKEESATINPEQHWYEASSGTALKDASVKALVESVQSLDWQELVAVNATGEQLTEYALTDDEAMALELVGSGDESLRLFIGNSSDSGDYYVRLQDSTMVYTISSDSLDELLGTSVDALRVTELVPLSLNAVDSVNFAADGQEWIVKCEYSDAETVADSAASEDVEPDTQADSGDTSDESDASVEEATEATLTVTVNEETADTSSIENLWSLVQSLNITEFDPQIEADGDAALRITIVSTGGTGDSWSFYAYDADSYAVISETGTALVSADTVDRIVRTLKQL